jgi:hypothetical protein
MPGEPDALQKSLSAGDRAEQSEQRQRDEGAHHPANLATDLASAAGQSPRSPESTGGGASSAA